MSNYIDRYYKSKQGKGGKFYDEIYGKMKKIGTDAIRASSGCIDPQKLENNFEIFGLDFMIDAKFNPWLIEINTNPCLEMDCPVLDRLIPSMVENAFRYVSLYAESE